MRRTLAIILYARLLINAQMRLVYPFLPVISRGLGLPLETTALLVGIRSLAGVTSRCTAGSPTGSTGGS